MSKAINLTGRDARIEHYAGDVSFSFPLVVPWYYAPHLAVLAMIVAVSIYGLAEMVWRAIG